MSSNLMDNLKGKQAKGVINDTYYEYTVIDAPFSTCEEGNGTLVQAYVRKTRQSRPKGGKMAGYPFTATIQLYLDSEGNAYNAVPLDSNVMPICNFLSGKLR